MPTNPRGLQLSRRLAGPAVLIALALAGPAAAHPLPQAPSCPIFPPDSAWNQRVDRLPAASGSATLIGSIGRGAPVHPHFGAGLWDGHIIGIPINVTSSLTPRVEVSFDPAYAPRADRGPYPLSPLTRMEPAPDRHVIVVDSSSCLDYELYAAQRVGVGLWSATTGVVFDLHSDRLRPPTWASADAAGLPILPGLARYDEVADGSIDHALRFTAPRTLAAFVYPARHSDSNSQDPSLPPMGLRVRLKASVNISHLPRQARIVALALKRYGMILADNGPPWNITGTSDWRWNNLELRALGQLTGRDFEVVDTSTLPHPGQ